MRIHNRWTFRLALIMATVAITYIGIVYVDSVQASLNGRVGFSGNPATNGGETCTTCHGPGATVPTVRLEGPTAVTAGTTHIYTVKVVGGPAVTAGLNVATSNQRGQLTPLDSETQNLLGELTHTVPKVFSGIEATFRFAWTAPTFNDTVTMYAAGNSSNGGQDLAGDGIAATALTIAVTGGASSTPVATPPAADTLGLVLVADGFGDAVDIANAGDARLFVVDKPGRIHILKNGERLATPFLNITTRVDDSRSEMGLLGLTFHPSYASNGYFYVNYTVGDPRRTRVSRFKVSTGSADLADANSELILMEFIQPDWNHNGGQLQFGPDGYLYISSGDGGGGGDPDNYGQNEASPLGKILRIDVDSTSGAVPDCNLLEDVNYRIPLGNPFADGAGGDCDEIWATGLRNPWRFSFDRATGDMWIGDVGQRGFEEIDFAPANSTGGENYGWRCYEGNATFNTSGCGPRSSYVFPIHAYDRDLGDCSVTGGYVYRGSASPSLNGHYFFSDFCRGVIRSINRASGDPAVTTWQHPNSNANPATFGEDVEGELYVGYLNGQLYRIVGNSAPNTPTPAPPTNTPTITPLPPTSTATNTAVPLTSTPTNTPMPPTATLVPTDTPIPPTDTPESTNTPAPTGTPVATATPTTCAMGDVTCDGAVNNSDARAIVEYDVGLRAASDTLPLPDNAIYFPRCDVSEDNVCNAGDAFIILQCAAGIDNVFCQE